MLKKIIKILKKEKVALIFIFLLSLTLPVLANVIPELNSKIINAVLIKDIKLIIGLSLGVILLYITKTYFNILLQNKIIKLNLGVVTKLKMEITEDIINQPLAFHDCNSSQYVLSRINEVDNFSKLFSTDIFSFFTNILSAIFALFMIAKKNIVLAIISVTLLPFFYLISQKLFKNMSTQINNSLESSAKANESLHAILTGTYALKQFNEEDNLLKKVFQDMQKLANKLTLQNATINKSGNLISMYTYIAQILLLGGVAIAIAQGRLSMGDYVALGQYFGLLFAPVISIQITNMSIKPALVAMKRMEAFVQDEEIQEKELIKEINSIEIEGLSFAYENNVNVISNVTFSLYKGEKILITGKNGSGKTTLAKILCGFYSNYKGKVLFNGIEIRDISEKCLRNHIAMLSQKNYLFNISIKENIRMANREMDASEFEKKMRYFQDIGLLEDVDLKENVIENGKQLSGGQIQRIALARILVREADVYIFDEFTNSLDYGIKKIMKEILKSEFKNKICIFIMHDNLLDDLIECRYQIEN